MLAEGHEYLTSSASLTPDGRTLVTAAVDGTTRIWDLRSGVEKSVLSGTGRAAVLAVSADGRLALTGDSAKGAQLWNLDDGTLLRTLLRIVRMFRPSRFSSRWNNALHGRRKRSRERLPNADAAPLWSQLVHSRRITGLLFTRDGKQLLSASLDNTVGRFQAADGHELRPLYLEASLRRHIARGAGAKHAVTTVKTAASDCGRSLPATSRRSCRFPKPNMHQQVARPTDAIWPRSIRNPVGYASTTSKNEWNFIPKAKLPPQTKTPHLGSTAQLKTH